MGLLNSVLGRLTQYEKSLMGADKDMVESKQDVPVSDSYHDSPFKRALNFTLKEEGGYIDDPMDPGGQTKYGISKAAYPNIDIGKLTLEQATAIYYNDYWRPFERLAEEHPKLAMVMFDTAVNMGTGTAIRLLQQAVGTKIDGVLGPMTIASIQTHREDVVSRILQKRILYYTSRPHWERFKGGWVTRVVRLAMEVV